MTWDKILASLPIHNQRNVVRYCKNKRSESNEMLLLLSMKRKVDFPKYRFSANSKHCKSNYFFTQHILLIPLGG